MFLWSERETECLVVRKSDFKPRERRQIDGQTDRRTDRQTDRQTDTQTGRESGKVNNFRLTTFSKSVNFDVDRETEGQKDRMTERQKDRMTE